jgi:serine/threonine-protein kinase
MGRFEEAIAAFERAVELDPLSHFASTGLGGAYALAGRHERAMAQLRKTVETEPEYGLAYVAMGEVYARQGLFADAIQEYERALTLLGPDAGVMSQLGCVYARSGKAAEARKMLAKLRASSKQRHVLPPFFAYLHAALGEKDEALEYLERGYAERSYPLVFLKVYPLYDPLREDPRFAALLERMRLR